MTDPHQILKTVFGFDSFRGVQGEVVERVLAGKHTLAVMPTGAGKSLCYQLPSLARPGTALVVSPLIALMHDQIRAADALGIKAASLTSADDRAAVTERFLSGELDLLYVAPERATGEAFRRLVDWQIEQGSTALVPCGTTGESATLTDAVAARLEEALASFYLALGRRKPPALRVASPLTARQTA